MNVILEFGGLRYQRITKDALKFNNNDLYRTIVEIFNNEYQAGNIDPVYQFSVKCKNYKKNIDSVTNFFKSFIANAPLEIVSRIITEFATRGAFFLSLNARAVRHVSAVSLLGLIDGLLVHLSRLEDEAIVLEEQIKGAGGNTSDITATRKKNSAFKSNLILNLEERYNAVQKSIDELSTCNSKFYEIICHRCIYDVSEEVRIAFVAALGRWMTIHPSSLVSFDRFRDWGCALDDISWEVRLFALEGIRAAYDSEYFEKMGLLRQDMTEAELSKTFTYRTYARILLMIADVNPRVQLAALKVISSMAKKDIFGDYTTVLVDQLVQFLFQEASHTSTAVSHPDELVKQASKSYAPPQQQLSSEFNGGIAGTTTVLQVEVAVAHAIGEALQASLFTVNPLLTPSQFALWEEGEIVTDQSIDEEMDGDNVTVIRNETGDITNKSANPMSKLPNANEHETHLKMILEFFDSYTHSGAPHVASNLCGACWPNAACLLNFKLIADLLRFSSSHFANEEQPADIVAFSEGDLTDSSRYTLLGLLESSAKLLLGFLKSKNGIRLFANSRSKRDTKRMQFWCDLREICVASVVPLLPALLSDFKNRPIALQRVASLAQIMCMMSLKDDNCFLKPLFPSVDCKITCSVLLDSAMNSKPYLATMHALFIAANSWAKQCLQLEDAVTLVTPVANRLQKMFMDSASTFQNLPADADQGMELSFSQNLLDVLCRVSAFSRHVSSSLLTTSALSLCDSLFVEHVFELLALRSDASLGSRFTLLLIETLEGLLVGASHAIYISFESASLGIPSSPYGTSLESLKVRFSQIRSDALNKLGLLAVGDTNIVVQTRAFTSAMSLLSLDSILGSKQIIKTPTLTQDLNANLSNAFSQLLCDARKVKANSRASTSFSQSNRTLPSLSSTAHAIRSVGTCCASALLKHLAIFNEVPDLEIASKDENWDPEMADPLISINWRIAENLFSLPGIASFAPFQLIPSFAVEPEVDGSLVCPVPGFSAEELKYCCGVVAVQSVVASVNEVVLCGGFGSLLLTSLEGTFSLNEQNIYLDTGNRDRNDSNSNNSNNILSKQKNAMLAQSTLDEIQIAARLLLQRVRDLFSPERFHKTVLQSVQISYSIALAEFDENNSPQNNSDVASQLNTQKDKARDTALAVTRSLLPLMGSKLPVEHVNAFEHYFMRSITFALDNEANLGLLHALAEFAGKHWLDMEKAQALGRKVKQLALENGFEFDGIIRELVERLFKSNRQLQLQKKERAAAKKRVAGDTTGTVLSAPRKKKDSVPRDNTARVSTRTRLSSRADASGGDMVKDLLQNAGTRRGKAGSSLVGGAAAKKRRKVHKEDEELSDDEVIFPSHSSSEEEDPIETDE